MLHRITLLFYILFGAFMGAEAQSRKTVLTAEVYDYQRDMVHFDCLQTPLINQEFHTNPGEVHEFAFETDKPVSMLINGQVKVFLQPGDSLHAVIRYNGKSVSTMDFSGTQQAVTQNRLYWDVERLRRSMRYRAQLLSCVVLDVKPKDRINDSRTLLSKVGAMLETAGASVSPEAASYILAEVESAVFQSLMEYPPMYAETRKLPIEQQEIGDYWTLMDGYTLRNDEVTLRCPEYAMMLMRYCFYENAKKAHQAGKEYQPPKRFEEIYKELAAFHQGEHRDYVLYMLLCNFIRNGKELERAEPLLADYKENYNKNEEYIRILDHLLQ